MLLFSIPTVKGTSLKGYGLFGNSRNIKIPNDAINFEPKPKIFCDCNFRIIVIK